MRRVPFALHDGLSTEGVSPRDVNAKITGSSDAPQVCVSKTLQEFQRELLERTSRKTLYLDEP